MLAILSAPRERLPRGAQAWGKLSRRGRGHGRSDRRRPSQRRAVHALHPRRAARLKRDGRDLERHRPRVQAPDRDPLDRRRACDATALLRPCRGFVGVPAVLGSIDVGKSSRWVSRRWYAPVERPSSWPAQSSPRRARVRARLSAGPTPPAPCRVISAHSAPAPPREWTTGHMWP